MQDIDFASISRRLKRIRTSQGLTQDYVANRSGFNASHISNIENNRVKVSLSALVHICNALHTTVDYVLCEDYQTPDTALDQAILTELQKCDSRTKEEVYQIIQVLNKR